MLESVLSVNVLLEEGESVPFCCSDSEEGSADSDCAGDVSPVAPLTELSCSLNSSN